MTHIPVTIHGDKKPEQNAQFVMTISNQSSNARLGGALTTIQLFWSTRERQALVQASLLE